MNATRAAALPRYRTENPGLPRENRLYRTGKPARFRPDLRVVYRAGSPVAVAPAASSAAAPSVSVHPAPAPPAAASLAPAPPAPAPLTAARPTPSRPRVSASSAASPLRLTTRGRIVIAIMVALLVAGLSLAVAGAAQATGHAASQRGTGSNLIQVVVRPGQSLWSVAENADPNSDPRLVIQQIAQLNVLTSDTLMAGQRLWVPRT
jgi:hypothetical protein